MQASRIVLNNAKTILKDKDFIIAVNISEEQAIQLEDQLVRNGKPSTEVLDWLHSNMPYFPRPFLENDAIYEVERKNGEFSLKFTMLLFSPLTMMSFLMRVDAVSGGFPIAAEPTDKEIEDFLEEEEEED